MKKLLILLFLIPALNYAQSRREIYIKTYKEIAIKEMKLYGIPASITLAQGILESGDGQSDLAIKANNHFGIKCHEGWTGAKVYHDDDSKGECFRKYKHAEESYRDHSEFLRKRSRYAALFELEKTDYEGWAKGLKKAGYATSPTYATSLIGLIEKNNLHQYDLEAMEGILLPEQRILLAANGAKYIELGKSESIEDLAKIFKKSIDKILRYNDLTYESVVKEGERIYVKAKKCKGANKFYKVVAGETVHSISQQEGVKVKQIYKRNRKIVGWQPADGETIQLRGRVKK